jgi:uncharacterized protein YdaU (DUF1376 family)
MSFHFMPWYHGDHLRATQRLNHEQQWAYFLLINEYWAKGELPDDDQQLARIAGLSPARWRKMKPIMQSFFYDGWHHKRIERELASATKKAKVNIERARKAANTRWDGHTEHSADAPTGDAPF